MVKPLGRPQIAVSAGGLDAAVGIEQHRPHHSGVVAIGGVLEGFQPPALCDHVVVEHDHVVAVARVLQAAVDARGVSAVVSRELELQV